MSCIYYYVFILIKMVHFIHVQYNYYSRNVLFRFSINKTLQNLMNIWIICLFNTRFCIIILLGNLLSIHIFAIKFRLVQRTNLLCIMLVLRCMDAYVHQKYLSMEQKLLAWEKVDLSYMVCKLYGNFTFSQNIQ